MADWYTDEQFQEELKGVTTEYKQIEAARASFATKAEWDARWDAFYRTYTRLISACDARGIMHEIMCDPGYG